MISPPPRRTALGVAAELSLSLALLACAPAWSNACSKAITVATGHWEPYAYYDAQKRFVGLDALSGHQREQIGLKRKAGNDALALMDEHLATSDWFVGDSISLADICLFAYTHVADEADFDLELYPHIIAWMERIIVIAFVLTAIGLALALA